MPPKGDAVSAPEDLEKAEREPLLGADHSAAPELPGDGAGASQDEKVQRGCCSCCDPSARPLTSLKNRLSASLPSAQDVRNKVTLPSHSLLQVNANGKVYAYDHEALLFWRCLFAGRGSIFLHPRVWVVIPEVLTVALIVGCTVFVILPSARKLNTDRFQEFVNYIKVFIAFMLGLFLNNSFKRWWASVSSFKRFLTSIKQLMYTLHAIGIRDDLFKEIERTCLASCYILNEEVHAAQEVDIEMRKKRWEVTMGWLQTNGFITAHESAELATDDRMELGVRSTILWMWIGDLMSQVRVEPNVAPPMYVRLLFLCHDCMNQVEELKTNLTVQIPFTYAHMLAVLVHIANILGAVTCGLMFGSALAEVVKRNRQLNDSAVNLSDAMNRELIGEMYEAVQVLGMQSLTVIIQPLIYQSFLVIAHALQYPYGDELCHMPSSTFIQALHNEINVMSAGKITLEQRKALKLAGDEMATKKKKKDRDDEEEEDDDDGD